jgi:DNA repair protein RecO (recombination protein O)
MTRTAEQAGWVLHRRPWRESSLLIEYFSEEHGRIGLVARGARAARSPWRGLAEPFCPLTASWTRRGEMGTLTGLEPAGPRHTLAGRALWCGLYANELLVKLLARDDPEPALCTAYAELLAELSRNESLALAVRAFELKLLEVLGVAPDFECDAESGAPVEADALYHLVPESGFVRAVRAGPELFPGQAILALARGEPVGGETARAGRRLMRALIDHQLGGRPLESRRLFENLSKQSGS